MNTVRNEIVVGVEDSAFSRQAVHWPGWRVGAPPARCR
jgi:hypothetical protein